MDQDIRILEMLLKDEVLYPVLIAVSIVTVVTVKSIAGVVRGVARERTRREIAAFIAEGSLSPEQGERLMKAGETGGKC